jgi:hypothetical protein
MHSDDGSEKELHESISQSERVISAVSKTQLRELQIHPPTKPFPLLSSFQLQLLLVYLLSSSTRHAARKQSQLVEAVGPSRRPPWLPRPTCSCTRSPSNHRQPSLMLWSASLLEGGRVHRSAKMTISSPLAARSSTSGNGTATQIT